MNEANFLTLESLGDPGCQSIEVGIRVLGQGFDENQIDAALGAKPDNGGCSKFGDITWWNWDTGRWLESYSLPAHVEVLLDRIGHPGKSWQAFLEKHRPQVDVYVEWQGEPGAEFPSLPPELIDWARGFGAAVKYEAGWDRDDHAADGVQVSFLVFGETLNPDAISDFFCQPSLAFRKGQTGLGKRSLDVAAQKFGRWSLDSEDLTDSQDFDEHLSVLLERLGPPNSAWRNYVRENGLSLRISAYWAGLPGSKIPIPSPRTRARIRAYLATFDLTVYQHDYLDLVTEYIADPDREAKPAKPEPDDG